FSKFENCVPAGTYGQAAKCVCATQLPQVSASAPFLCESGSYSQWTHPTVPFFLHRAQTPGAISVGPSCVHSEAPHDVFAFVRSACMMRPCQKQRQGSGDEPHSRFDWKLLPTFLHRSSRTG